MSRGLGDVYKRQGHACLELLWQPRKAENMGVLVGAAACERSRKWGYRGGSRLGYKLKAGHHVGQRLDREDNVRPHATKRGKGLSLVGHERVPCGFGLRTGDCGGDTADGAGNLGRAAQPRVDYWEEPGV